MEKIIVHFLSDYAAVFKIFENNNLLMSVNTTESLCGEIELELLNPISFDVSVYPITKKQDKNLYSYSAVLKYQNNQLTSRNEYLKIYKLPENHFIIKFLPFSLASQEITGDKLEASSSEIKKLSFVNDLAGRAKIEVLKVDSKKILKEDEYYVYTNENYEKETNPDLILLSFFESYLAKDYGVCLSYLASNFKMALTKEDLKNFLGNYSSCSLVNYYSYPSVVLLYEDHATVFSADIDESNKILDLYEIN